MAKKKGTKLNIVKYVLPAYWASALINGDYSGLDDDDAKMLDAWLKREKPGFAVDAEDEHFAHRNDAGTLPGDVMTYTFHQFG